MAGNALMDPYAAERNARNRNALYQIAMQNSPRTVDNAVLEMFGMQPGMDRLNFLPRYDSQQGWIAPNALYQVARALVSPGVAAQGGAVSPEDAVNFGGVVGSGGIGASALMRNPAPGAGKTVAMATRAADNDYRGVHRAPMRDGGDPLHAVDTNVYPSDIYGANGAQYYGHGEPFDYESMRVIQSLRGRPNAAVTIYRAVPYEKTAQEQAAAIQKQIDAYMKRRIVPAEWGGSKTAIGDEQGFYSWAKSELQRLEAMPPEAPAKLGINAGDWVTTSRAYAKQHGESALGGKYKVVSKTVRAKDLFTDGNSIHEWGYDPAADK